MPGSSDPYCCVSLADGLLTFKTAVRKNNLRPVWNETFVMPVQDPAAQRVVVSVYDWNNLRPVWMRMHGRPLAAHAHSVGMATPRPAHAFTFVAVPPDVVCMVPAR